MYAILGGELHMKTWHTDSLSKLTKELYMKRNPIIQQKKKKIFKYQLTHYVSYVVVYPFALPIWFLSQNLDYFLELSFGATQLIWSY